MGGGVKEEIKRKGRRLIRGAGGGITTNTHTYQAGFPQYSLQTPQMQFRRGRSGGKGRGRGIGRNYEVKL